MSNRQLRLKPGANNQNHHKPKKVRCGEDFRIVRIKGRPNWHVQFYEGGKRNRIPTGLNDLAEASAELERIKANHLRGARRRNTTVRTPLHNYIEVRAHRVTSVNALRERANRICSVVGDVNIKDVTRSTGAKYIRSSNERRIASGKEEYAPRTIRDDLSMLKSALKFADEEGWIDRIPSFDMPRIVEENKRFLTREEARHLYRCCKSEHLKDFVMIALNTGARKGVILDLTWDRVGFDKTKFTFRKKVM